MQLRRSFEAGRPKLGTHRRSERLELLKGESTHEAKADGTVVLNVKIPIRQAPQIIT